MNFICSTIGHTSGSWVWDRPCIRCGAVPGRRPVKQDRPPVKCPVCEGRGNLPTDFYLHLGASTSTAPVQCRTLRRQGGRLMSGMRTSLPVLEATA